MFEKTSTWIFSAVVLIVVIVLGVTLFSDDSSSNGSSPASSKGGELVFDEMKWDIGDVSMKDGYNIKEIPFTNTTGEDLTVTEMLTSCMCTKAQIVHEDGSTSRYKGMPGHGEPSRMNEEIKAGEKAILRVQYDPNAHGPDATGRIRRSITIKTNSPEQSEVVLNFDGNVTK